jgi:hypothetical protein
MDDAHLGQSGVSISRVGLGVIELGPTSGDAPDVDRAVAAIEAAAHRTTWQRMRCQQISTRVVCSTKSRH